jgi:hypothetical protein
MGSATSRPKSLSLPGRTGSTRLRRTSSQSSSPSLKESRSDSLAGSIPSTASSSRIPSIDQAEAQSILISQKLQEKLAFSAAPRSSTLSQHELSLVHSTWQMVISDSSNICLNFFLQLKKGKPKTSKFSKSGSSTPLSQSPPSHTVGSKFLLAGSKHSDLIYFALRLSCCIDRLIFHLRLESCGAVASNRKSMPEFLLDESGELQEFLGLDALLGPDLERLVRTFTETLRLVMVHSQQAKNVWSEEIQSAWTKLLYNLIEVLKNSY